MNADEIATIIKEVTNQAQEERFFTWQVWLFTYLLANALGIPDLMDSQAGSAD